MAPNLRAGRSRSSTARARASADPCPVCLEPLTEDQFRFPCGHGVCNGCNGRLARRDFLSCPTCRTPREGVSQRQVDAANRARVREDNGDEGDPLVVYAGGRAFEVIFFPDESDGQNPFAALDGPPGTLHEVGVGGARTHEMALQAAEAAMEAEASRFGPRGRRENRRVTLHGPMRDLVNALTRPTTVQEFLAQRERVLVDDRAPRGANAGRHGRGSGSVRV